MTSPGTRLRSRWPLAAVLLVAALLRLAYLGERRAAPDFQRPEVDAAFHDDWARCLAFGEDRAAEWRDPHEGDPGLSTEPYLRPPGYPFLLAAVYRASGGSPTAAVVAQMLLGLAAVVLAYLLAARFGPASALLAGAAVGTHWALVYFEGELHAPPLLIALQLGMAWTLLRAADGGRRGLSFAAGVLLGLSALTRPNALAELPFVALWLARVLRGRSGLAHAGLLALGTCAAIAPVTARNLAVSGELVAITANDGVNLWIGNHAGADGLVSDELLDLGRFHTCYDWPRVVENLERKVGHPLGAGDVSAWFRAQALDWITSHPGAFVALTLRKAALLFGPREVAHNKDVAQERAHSAVLRFLPWPFSALLFAAVLGVSLFVATRRSRPDADAARGEDRALVLFGLIAGSFALSLLPFFAAARYRVPLLPWLALGFALVPRWRAASTRGRALSVAAAALCALVPWLGSPAVGLDQGEKYHLDRGRSLYNAGRADEARVELEQALALGGGSDAAHFELGVLEHRLGRWDAARQHYEECLRRNPRHALARFNLGFVLEESGDVRAAIQTFREAAELDPTAGTASFQQGRLLAATGRFDKALDALREAVARDPEQPDFRRTLARLYATVPDAALRDPARALELAEALPADSWLDEETRALCRAAAGRASDALAAARRALELAERDGAPAPDRARLERVRQALEEGRAPWTVR